MNNFKNVADFLRGPAVRNAGMCEGRRGRALPAGTVDAAIPVQRKSPRDRRPGIFPPRAGSQGGASRPGSSRPRGGGRSDPSGPDRSGAAGPPRPIDQIIDHILMKFDVKSRIDMKTRGGGQRAGAG
jgi:hypothetical protein